MTLQLHRTSTLTENDITQRVICADSLVDLLPSPGETFDLWHEGMPWASKLRREPCTCQQLPTSHEHFYLEGGEIHAGLRWETGAVLHVEQDEDGRLTVSGSLEG